MSVGTSGSTMNPKPFFSLNHLTVPLAIESTERANHPDPNYCLNSRNFAPTKRLARKGRQYIQLPRKTSRGMQHDYFQYDTSCVLLLAWLCFPYVWNLPGGCCNG